MTITVQIPGVRVASLNVREHWSMRARRCRTQREATILALRASPANQRQLVGAEKLRITLTRLGGRKLDRDNLAGAFKPILDGVCQWLGIDDGDEERLAVEWKQEPGGGYGVRIAIETVSEEVPA